MGWGRGKKKPLKSSGSSIVGLQGFNLGAAAFSGGNLLFCLSRNRIGLVVLRAIVAGLVPQFLALSQFVLGLADVNLGRMQRRLSENRHPLRQHLDEAPGNEELLVAR